jgi:hypothetical protein
LITTTNPDSEIEPLFSPEMASIQWTPKLDLALDLRITILLLETGNEVCNKRIYILSKN